MPGLLAGLGVGGAEDVIVHILGGRVPGKLRKHVQRRVHNLRNATHRKQVHPVPKAADPQVVRRSTVRGS